MMSVPAIRILLFLLIGVQAVFAQPTRSFYLSFYRPSVTSARSLSESSLSGDMINQKIKRDGLSVMLGFERASFKKFFDSFFIGWFIGGGALGNDVGEFITGTDIKKMLWISKGVIAVPISLGFAGRVTSSDYNKHIPDGYDHVSYHYSHYDDGREKNNLKLGVDIMPSIDLQYFIQGRFSFYVGCMPRIRLEQDYKGDSNIVKEEERIFGIPGTFRFGVKLH